MSDLEPGFTAPDADVAPLTRRAARESAAAASRFTPNFRRRRLVVGGIASAVGIAIVAVVVVFAILGQAGKVDEAASPSPSASRTPTSTPTPSPTPTPTPTPEVPIADIDTAWSLTVVVNKHRPLTQLDYYPDVVPVPVPYANEPFLRQEAADAVVQMFAAITAETGLELQAQSAFRSYDTQVSVYQGHVDNLGQEAADLTSARPGYSEHQTGLAIDVNALPDQGCALSPCWADTAQGQWVAANAWRFGFIVRYQNGQTPITGYEYEPYHLRFVGPDIAKDMHDRGILSLEQYFGLDPAPDYPSDSV